MIAEEFPGDEPVRLSRLVDVLETSMIKRIAHGRPFGVAVLAEGIGLRLPPDELEKAMPEVERDEHGHVRLAELELDRLLAKQLRDRFKERGQKRDGRGQEHRLRAALRAPPVPFDIEYTRDLGYSAVDYLKRALADDEPGGMITIQDGHMVPLPFGSFSDPETGRVRIRLVNVESSSYRVAREYMIRLDREDLEDPEKLGPIAAAAGSRPRPSAAGTAISPGADSGRGRPAGPGNDDGAAQRPSRRIRTGHPAVLHTVLAHRAEQYPGEPAVPAAADDQQVSALGRAYQHVRGVPLDHRGGDRDIGRDAADLGERLGQDLARVTLHVDRAVADRSHAVANGYDQTVTASTSAPVTFAWPTAQRRALIEAGEPSTPTTIRFVSAIVITLISQPSIASGRRPPEEAKAPVCRDHCLSRVPPRRQAAWRPPGRGRVSSGGAGGPGQAGASPCRGR